MYPRKFSLNKPSYVFKYGEVVDSEFLILKYVKALPISANSSGRYIKVRDILVNEDFPRFCIVVSNKFTSKATVKTQLRRAISVGIEKSLKSQYKGWFVFIPKRRILDQNDKITVDVEKISSDAYSLLSKVVLI